VAGGSVTVLSHPSLAGITNNTGISGSTAWHGAFRFRQYLTTPKTKESDGEQPDNDLRELKFLKNQYGRRDDNIVLRYQNGLFLPEAKPGSLERLAQEAAADETFMELLRARTEQNRNTSDAPTSGNYAPRIFAEEELAKKRKVRETGLADAMRRLFAHNKICLETYGRHNYSRIAETSK
jgi:RecA-family ATPase